MRPVTQADINSLNRDLQVISNAVNRVLGRHTSAKDKEDLLYEIGDLADGLELEWR